MRERTMVDAAKIVLMDRGAAMSVREIYDEITRRGLYTFGAKDPVSVLSGALRKTVRDGSGLNLEDGRFRIAE